MFLLVFGIIWTLFSSLFLIIPLVAGEGFDLFIIIPVLFIGIGIFLITISAKKIIKNKKTDKYGEICYGIIQSIYNSGTYINGVPELKADVLVYFESQNKIENVSEIIGMGKPKYNINSVVKLKYYEGDINFIEEVTNFDYLSENIRIFIDNNKINTDNNDIIEINGIKYKRID